MKRNLLILLLLASLVSCKKEDQTGDGQMPIIRLTAPTNNQAFSPGETITISATITDNVIIREVHLEIINTATGTFLAHEHFSPKSASYELSKTFVGQANATYKIKVEAEDGQRNNARSEVSISSK
ncbi:MAG TPA: Ig-like domain-containing protein [Flavisolibacter sp.]|nr:Ig-like domain-containing protein [Flavisolibacter sp.]